MKRIRVKTRRILKELSREQVEKLLAHVRGDRIEPIVGLALFAGMRAEECSHLQWGDVDLVNALVHVTAKSGWSPKSSAERSIPIPASLVDFLKRLKHGMPFNRSTDWVCQRDATIGVQWERVYMGQCVKETFQTADLGIPPGTFHKLHLLRGTYAVACLRGGADLESLRVNLGHSDVKVTAMYLNATDDSRRRAPSLMPDAQDRLHHLRALLDASIRLAPAPGTRRHLR